jgi:ADP-ribose pyrophosphatase
MRRKYWTADSPAPVAHARPSTAPASTKVLSVLADPLSERTVDSRVVHSGGYLTFRIDTIEDPDGGRHTREIVVHPGAVAIVALDGDDLLMVRQFRTPAGRVLLEIPAGTLNRGEAGDPEAANVAAARELEEETGYRAGSWRRLGSFFSAPGFATEELTLYLAQDLTAVEDYPGPAPDERLQLVRVPWRRAVEMADAGELADAKTLVGVFWLSRLADAGEI